jgi:ribosomal protein S27E
LSEWVKIKSKYANSKCGVCQDTIPEGDPVLWKKGEGIRHDKCPPIKMREEDKPKLIITPEEWEDYKQYSYKQLQTVINCQCCGRSLKHKDVWIDDDRKTCEACHVE